VEEQYAHIKERKRFIAEIFLNAYQTNPKPFEDLKKEQLDWVNGVNNTQLKYDYANADRTDLQTFIDSIMLQRDQLSYTYLYDNLNAFANFFKE